MNVKVRQLAPAILGIILMIMTAGCGGNDDTSPPPPPPTLTSISITPVNPSIAPGTTQQFTATGNYSNGSHLILTSSVTWLSSNSVIADVGDTAGTKGLATANAIGGTTISANYSGITGATALSVSPVASLAVTPADPPSIAPGTTLQFNAIGTLADSTVQTLTTWATWSSSDAAIVTVNGAPGLATATNPAPGSINSATISAAYSGVTGTTTFTSSTLSALAVSPTSASIPKGTTFQFQALGTLADANTQTLTTVATWGTSSPGIATISNAAGLQGRATAVSLGTTTVTAQFNGILSQATLSVTPAILSSLTVTPVDPSIALGKTLQFTAIGRFTDNSLQDMTSLVTWDSSLLSVATITNTAGLNGLATSKAQGTTTISAALGSISASTTLRVTPVALESISITPLSAIITKGSTTQYTAIGNYSNNTTKDLTAQAIWSSSNIFIATISNGLGTHGLAQASLFTSGTTTITATMSGVTSNAAVLTVQ